MAFRMSSCFHYSVTITVMISKNYSSNTVFQLYYHFLSLHTIVLQGQSHSSKNKKQLLSERIRQIHFTIDTLEAKINQRRKEIATLLPSEFMVEISKLFSRTQSIQRTKVKEHQTHIFSNLQTKHRTKTLSWMGK